MAHVLRGKARPNHVRKKTRYVNKNPRRKALIVRKSQKPDAGSYTRSQNSNSAIAAAEQPIGRAAGIQNCLPDSGNGSPNVWRNQILRPLEMSGPAIVVIRQAEAQ